MRTKLDCKCQDIFFHLVFPSDLFLIADNKQYVRIKMFSFNAPRNTTFLPGFSFPTNSDMSLGLFMFFPLVETFEY